VHMMRTKPHIISAFKNVTKKIRFPELVQDKRILCLWTSIDWADSRGIFLNRAGVISLSYTPCC